MSHFTLNQNIIWLRSNNADVAKTTIQQGTITRLGKDSIWINGLHKPEDQLYAAFCFPDVEECRKLLQDIIDMNKRHKEEEYKMISRQYEMRNRIARKEI